jgi:hypothetical protein
MTKFEFTRESQINNWSNYHATISNRKISKWLAPDVMALPGAVTPDRMEQQGRSLTSILEYCFNAKPGEILASFNPPNVAPVWR